LGAEITSAELAASDPAWWATKHNTIRLQKGNYSFDGREYLLEPMRSKFNRRAYIKGSQGGGSTTEILKSFHGMIFGRYPGGVLYLFPSTEAMQGYSKAVMGPLIQANRGAIGRYVRNIKSNTDSASLKQINGSNLFMRGAGLPKIIEGEGYAAMLQGITVDKVVFDEIELMDEKAIAKAKARMGDSEVEEEVYIGNPGIPDRGIDAVFQRSDQRHWFRKCQRCGEWTCAELSFPDCVKIRPDGTGYIGCNKCGQRVFVRDGQWVAGYRDKSDYMHGYQWSHLTSPNNDPASVLEDFTNPPDGNLADVYRLRLGLPYISSEEKLTESQVLACCGPFMMPSKDPGPCAFGLDVGIVKHLVIGKRIGQNNFEIVKIARLSEWSQIEHVIDEFNCQSGVVDARPYQDEARRFQGEMDHIRTFLCEYSDSTTLARNFNIHTKMVKVNRTEIFDESHHLVSTKGLLTLPRRELPEVQEFARQVANPAKILEQNKRTKEMVYRYRGKEDHYRNALNYFLLAAGRIGIAKPVSRRRRKHQHETVMNDYKRI
jgi:hypothetical protein